jgi:PAS domain S-box-containing protein
LKLRRPIRAQSLCSRGSALSAVLIGGTVLIGWALKLPILVAFPSSGPRTLPTTAVGLMLAGIALLLIKQNRTGTERLSALRRGTANALGAVVLLLGVLTLTEYLFRVNLGIDRLLFRSDLSGGLGAGRPSQQSALNLTLAGLALLTLEVGNVRGRRPAEFMALAVAGLSLLALGGHAYQVPELYRIRPHDGISLYAAVGFMVLSIAILTSPRTRGLMNITASKGAARRLLRILAPLAVLLPLLPLAFTAWIVPRYNEPIEVGMAALSTLLIGILIWYIASSVNRAEAERRRAKQRLSAVLEAVPAGIVALSANGTIVQVNSKIEGLFGHRRQELLGRSVEILVPVRLRTRPAAAVNTFFSNRPSRPMGLGLGPIGLHADGTEFPIDTALRQTETEDGPLAIAVVRSIDPPIRVLLVDDHRSFSEALATVVDLEPDLECVGVVATVEEALKLDTPQPPNVVVLGIHLPDMAEIEDTRRVREHLPEAHVLVLTEQAGLEDMARAASVGASGFLPKEASLESILGAIRSANDHGMVVARSTVLRILAHARRGERPNGRVLSGREPRPFWSAR